MDDEAERSPAQEEEQDEQEQAAPQQTEVSALDRGTVEPKPEDEPDDHQHPKE